jgi:hypothetical protein
VPWHERVRPDCGLFELSVAVGVDDGDRAVGSIDDVIGEIKRSRRHTSTVGVLFHHQVFAQPASEAHLDAVLDGLQQLKDVTFHTLGQLYDRPAARDA